MTKRAEKMLASAGYNSNENPAISALVEFAAQNSGIETGNYFDPYDRQAGRMQTYRDGVNAYRQEQRSISADLKRFKEALSAAHSDGVKDADVIEAAPRAFSGRLTWRDAKLPKCVKCGADALCSAHATENTAQLKAYYATRNSWEYCTSQYFPTEYRKAAATVIEAATRTVRQARPAQKAKVASIADLKRLNEQNGGCWFEKASMRFFGTRIESGILRGHYFITSEQQDDDRPRKFTVRSFDDEGSIETVGEFHAHDSKASAIEAMHAHISGRDRVAA
jgi:hypothetical protein